MSVQSSLTTFFNARKRSSVDEVKKHVKVRIVEDTILENSNSVDGDDPRTVLVFRNTREVVKSDILEEFTSPKIPTRVNDVSRESPVALKSLKKSNVKKDTHKTKKSLRNSRQKSLRDIFSNLADSGKETIKTSFSEDKNLKFIQDICGKASQSDSRKETSKTSFSEDKNLKSIPDICGKASQPYQSSEKLKVSEDVSLSKEDVKAGPSNVHFSSPAKRPVVFEKKGILSPRKVNDSKRILFKTPASIENAPSAKERHSESQEKSGIASSAASGSFKKMSRKELSLSEIKGRLKGNPRLAELRKSLVQVSSCAAKIREADRETTSELKPGLKKFESIEFEVPLLNSPKKIMPASPLKTPPTSPIPAYKRYSHLTSPQRIPISPSKVLFSSPTKGSPLGLPYQYRCLAEIFRCVEVVSAMMLNRKEQISFNKLRPAVQEMLRRNITEQHIGQIKKVFPEAYEHFYKKVNQLTVSSAKAERYELILRPVWKSKESENVAEDNEDILKADGKTNIMTPSLLLERRHKFHKNLLEIVKDHHEEFLRSLDPPMVVPREKLTRWHPTFEIDLLPEVEPAELPQPPNAAEKCSSAKDVLGRARDLFGCNSRMEKALEKVSMSDSKEKETAGKDGPSASTSTNPPEIVPFTNPALKGIPLALLKKVRERQAAKVLMAMTMSPEEEKKAEQLSHLPELARILRGIYVSERKGVLSLETVLKKLGDSYRGNLNTTELEKHLKLLEESVPGWITRCTVRHVCYIKLSKDADLSRVIAKLEKMANDANR